MPSKQNPLDLWVSQIALLDISAVYVFLYLSRLSSDAPNEIKCMKIHLLSFSELQQWLCFL